MPSVDRDLDEIINFCNNFDSQYLQPMEALANELKGLTSKIESALYNTKFSTEASSSVSDTAAKIISAVNMGEQRIREIKKKTEKDRDDYERF